jgi:undecaprenyl-diphosphatase
MHWLAAALLGLVQGLTEFLPVSSTGSIVAVVWLYRVKIARVLRGLTTDPEARHFVLMLLAAFVPTALAGLLLAGFVKRVLYTTPSVIAWSFLVGGIVMIVVERYRPRPDVENADHVSLARAFGIGVCQSLALIPGVSRSGATIVGAMLFGIDRPAAAEFSFFLAIPTMSAAFVHDFWEVRHSLSAARAEEIAIGFVMAFIASALVIRPFLTVVRRSGFIPFAWYRIALGLLLAAAIAAHWL